MKPQDLAFFITYGSLLFVRRERLFVYAGLISLALAIPLFAKWVFFTAERLVWYAAAFFFTAVVYNALQRRKAE